MTFDSCYVVILLDTMAHIQNLRPDVDWTDADRINVLYAPFRTKELNPEGYEIKMTFWSETLTKWLEKKKTFRFSIKDFAMDFQDKNSGRRPLCLNEVLLNLRDQNKSIVEINEFRKSLVSGTWAEVPWRLIKAGTSMLASALSPKNKDQRKNEVNDQQFIHLELIEQLSNQLFHKIKDTGDAYCKKDDVITNIDDDNILLEYLKHQKNVIDITTIDNEVYIKDTSKNKSVFNETDIAIIKLEVCIEKLEYSTTELDHRLQAKKVELKNLISKREPMSKAKNVLIQVKRLSKELDTKTLTIDNLRQVLQTIETAQENIKVVSALKAAKFALNNEVNVTSDEVQDLVEDIKELVEKNEDVSEAIFSPHDSSDDDLEEELNKMIEEENDSILEKAFQDIKLQNHELTNDEKLVVKRDKEGSNSPERQAELAI